jgi:hypothetical protein
MDHFVDVGIDGRSCRLVDRYRRVGGTTSLNLQSRNSKMETKCYSETIVHIYKTTRRHVPREHIIIIAIRGSNITGGH